MSFGKVPLRRVECRLRTHVVAAALHRLHAVVEDDTAQRVYLMLELMSGRSLASARLVYSEPAAKRLMYQLLTALAFVHDHDIVHRDVKPSNCLLSKDETLLKLAYVCGGPTCPPPFATCASTAAAVTGISAPPRFCPTATMY